ncbi:MAG: cytochrome P460 family protein [Bacteroidales bacterium]
MRNSKQKTQAIIRFSIPLVLVAAALILYGYAQEKPTQQVTPEAEPEAFLNHIMEANPYTEWDFWPGYEGMYEGQSPHGDYLKLYVNEIATLALVDEKDKMPLSSIIIKENYNKNKEVVAITAMYKVDGYNPEAGDWWWVKYGKDNETVASGKVQSCIDCHNEAEKNDFLFSISP